MSAEQVLNPETLIKLVEERPILWDKTMKRSDRTKIKEAWRDICVTLNPNFESMSFTEKYDFDKLVITKWCNIRDNWVRSHKRQKLAEQYGLKAKHARQYLFYNECSFLKKIYDEEDFISNRIKKIKQEYMAPASASTSFDAGARKRENSNSMRAQSKRFRVSDQDDPHVCFFTSLMPSITQFNEEETLDFRLGVLNLLKEIRDRSRYHFAEFVEVPYNQILDDCKSNGIGVNEELDDANSSPTNFEDGSALDSNDANFKFYEDTDD